MRLLPAAPLPPLAVPDLLGALVLLAGFIDGRIARLGPLDELGRLQGLRVGKGFLLDGLLLAHVRELREEGLQVDREKRHAPIFSS